MYTPSFSSTRKQQIRELYEHHACESWTNMLDRETKGKGSLAAEITEAIIYDKLDRYFNDKFQFIQGDH